MSRDEKIMKQEPAEEIIILLEKRDGMLDKLIEAWNTIKYPNY